MNTTTSSSEKVVFQSRLEVSFKCLVNSSCITFASYYCGWFASALILTPTFFLVLHGKAIEISLKVIPTFPEHELSEVKYINLFESMIKRDIFSYEKVNFWQKMR